MTYFGNPCTWAHAGHSNERYSLGGECVECCDERYARMSKERPTVMRFHPKNKWLRQQRTENAARGKRAALTRANREVVSTDPLLAWLLAP